MTDSSLPSPTRLAGGIVAYQEEQELPRAVASLLASELPPGVAWSGLWIVVSPGTDATVAVARELAAGDPRIRLVEEPRREGKGAALARLLGAMDGDVAALLNGDAEADPGAVGALLDAVPAPLGPYAVMARPVARRAPTAGLDRALRLLWQLHHELHEELLGSGSGTHLSDELLLVSLRHRPPLTAGIINDGAFIGGWLVREGGRLAYAPTARVRVAVPTTFTGLIEQRRRIHRGHRQVHRITGVAPSTLDRRLVRAPRAAFALLRRSMDTAGVGVGALGLLAVCELAAITLALSDRLLHRPEPVAWTRVPTRGPASPGARAERRGGE